MVYSVYARCKCGEEKPKTVVEGAQDSEELDLPKATKKMRATSLVCRSCGEEKTKAHFPKEGLLCKECKKKRSRGYKNKKRPSSDKKIRVATPKWLTKRQKDQILEIYAESWVRRALGEDVHVDHIIPLRGKTVCGLHVPWNLRVIPASENLSKNNKVL